MTILQKDISVTRTAVDGKFDYQLVIKDEPVLGESSSKSCDFAIVNIQPDGKVVMELYGYGETILEADFFDPDTFIVPISSKIL